MVRATRSTSLVPYYGIQRRYYMRMYVFKHRHSTKHHVTLQKNGEALVAGRKEEMSRLHLEDHFGAVVF